MDQQLQHAHAALAWEAHEYEHRERKSDWYWALGIIMVALFVTALLFKNILLGIIVLIGTFGIVLHTFRRPSVMAFEINERGIMLNRRLYPWASLQSFSMSHHPSTKIYLQSKKQLVPMIVIPFHEVDYVYIRDFLKDFIHEVEHEVSLIEHILDFLGF